MMKNIEDSQEAIKTLMSNEAINPICAIYFEIPSRDIFVVQKFYDQNGKALYQATKIDLTLSKLLEVKSPEMPSVEIKLRKPKKSPFKGN